MIAIQLFLCLLICRSICGSNPRVEVETGVLIGRYRYSNTGKSYLSFEGVPYAEPPIGERRFKEPEPRRKWQGEWNATQSGDYCLQLSHLYKEVNEQGKQQYQVVGDEDCLYLNVYTKKGFSNKNVIFFIHPGAFMFFGGRGLGPDYLMDYNDFVVVTISYRLGVFGFFTTGDKHCPGNNGLKDQNLALRWVYRNIGAFGGSRNKISLVGLSAGGASVLYHMISPLSKGLFTRGLAISGSPLNPWAFVRDGLEKSQEITRLTGCPTTNSKTIINCLRKRPGRVIVSQERNFQPWLYNPFTVFGPSVEPKSKKAFLPAEPRKLLSQKKVEDVPLMMGFTTHEGLYPAAEFIDNEGLLKQLADKWDEYAPALLHYKEDPNLRHVATAIKEHYIGRGVISKESRMDLVEMVTDRLFTAGIAESATLLAKALKKPVYLYRYAYTGSVSVSQMFSGTNSSFGSSHGDDFAYLVKLSGFETHITKQDVEMHKFLYDMLKSFLIHGTPPSRLMWEQVLKTDSSRLNYLQINSVSDFKMGDNENLGNLEFLTDLFSAELSSKSRDEL